jgi:hypothetical protein
MNRESYGSNQAYWQQRALQFTESEMSVACQLIDAVYIQDFDGTEESLERVFHLGNILFTDPLNFFDEYFAAMDSSYNKELRTAAIEFVKHANFDPHSMEQLKVFSGAR